MYTVTETPLFQRLVVAVWTDEERNEFIGWLSSNPLAGDVIPAAGGLRKVRWSRTGMGNLFQSPGQRRHGALVDLHQSQAGQHST